MTRFRSYVAPVLLAVLAVSAGCSGAVTAPETVQTSTGPDYEITNVSSWTAGTTFEYRGALVVTGTLRSTADSPQPVPRIEARIDTADGRALVAASYKPDRRLVGFDEVRNRTLDSGESIDFRVVWEPDTPRTVTNVTVRTVRSG